MIKAAIFDLDGTIGNTLPICISAFRRAIEPFLLAPLSDEEIISRFGPSEEGTLREMVPCGYSEAMERFLQAYEALHAACPEPFDGMVELFEWLQRKKMGIALVTGKGPESCRITLNHFGIGHFFDTVETGSPLGPVKEQGIRKVLRFYGFPPEEAIYIGDAPSDITACRSVGIPIISAAWAPMADIPALRALAPDTVFTSVARFAEFLHGQV